LPFRPWLSVSGLVVDTARAAAGWSVASVAAWAAVAAGWVRQVAACLAVRAALADSCAAPAVEGVSDHLVAVVERRASLARLPVAAVGLLVLSVGYGLVRALVLFLLRAPVSAPGRARVLFLLRVPASALVLLSVRALVVVCLVARRLARASADRRRISRAVGCGSSITATSTFLCRLLAPGFGVMILAGGTPIGGGSTATTADTRPCAA
jgi:hypothetical protein